MKQLAHSVRDCMKGWGTDDEGLITCLVHLEDFKKAALIKEYKLEFGRDVFQDIKSDTSGDYERALCALVKEAPQVWAEALTGAMKGLGTADELLINFMVLAKEDMMAVRKCFHGLNKKMLEDWIESETSGDYKKTLLMLAGRNSEDQLITHTHTRTGTVMCHMSCVMCHVSCVSVGLALPGTRRRPSTLLRCTGPSAAKMLSSM